MDNTPIDAGQAPTSAEVSQEAVQQDASAAAAPFQGFGQGGNSTDPALNQGSDAQVQRESAGDSASASASTPGEYAKAQSDESFKQASDAEQAAIDAAAQAKSHLSPDQADRAADFLPMEPFNASIPVDEMPSHVQAGVAAISKDQQDAALDGSAQAKKDADKAASEAQAKADDLAAF